MNSRRIGFIRCLGICTVVLVLQPAFAQQAPDKQDAKAPTDAKMPFSLPTAKPAKPQAELETELAKALSGATLEGSFNSTGASRDATRIQADKYTLGQVKKLSGNLWTIEAQFQGRMIPLPIPILWAGNTPIITIDEYTIPGMGTYTARVMFFEDHYSGYWKHGDRGGNMFGVVHRAQPADAAPGAAPAKPPGEAAPAATTSDASKK